MNINSVSNFLNNVCFQNNNSNKQILLKQDNQQEKILNLNLSPSAFNNKSAINFGSRTIYSAGTIDRIKNDLKKPIENKDYERILQYLGMSVKEQDEQGMMRIKCLYEPDNDFDITYGDIGVDINDLLTKIKSVDMYINLPREKNINSTGGIEKIRGGANLGNNEELTKILADKYLRKIKTDLAKPIKNKDYKTILKYFDMKICEQDENGLMTVSGNLEEPNSSLGITYKTIGVDVNALLGHVKEIWGDIDLTGDKELKTTGALEKIIGNAHFGDCSKLSEITNLKKVRYNIFLKDTPLTSTGSLEEIGYYAYFPKHLTKFPNIKYINHVCDATEEQEQIFREQKLTDWYQVSDAEREKRSKFII